MIANDPEHDYSPFDDELPTVQIPLGRDQLGLTIEGRFVPHYELPDEAREALLDFLDGGGRPGGMGQTEVHMCDDCAERDDQYGSLGYLTTSDKAGSNAYNRRKYTCSNSWREEQTTNGGTTAGRFAPENETWDIDLKVNGADSRVIQDDNADRTYTLTVRRKAEYAYEADVLGETTVELPDEAGTIQGETDGKKWEADVEIRGETARVEWRRVDEDGNTEKYAYRETDGLEHANPNDKLGLLPLDDTDLGSPRDGAALTESDVDADEYDVDGETVIVRELAATTKSRVRERECGGTSFTRVWPNGTLVDDEDIVPVPELTDADVPNAKSHLSRIQSQLDDSVSKDEMLKTVAEACHDFWEKRGYPDWHPKNN